MNQCERCLKHTDGVHTCTPTEFVRKLEAKASMADELATAIDKCLEENGHLADGDDCTLYDLKVAYEKYKELSK